MPYKDTSFHDQIRPQAVRKLGKNATFGSPCTPPDQNDQNKTPS